MWPKDLVFFARTMRKSAPGRDAWTKEELVALPEHAWADFLEVWLSGTLSATSLMWHKRVPIEKSSGDGPRASDFRPVDVFSKVIRVLSAAQVSALKSWTRQVLLPTQFASFGGVEKAVATLNLHVEMILHKVMPVWGISIDFAKLFNTISPEVVERIAILLGLQPESAADALRPIYESVGVWRLPRNTLCPWLATERGLPQGLSISVVMSELFLSVLIRKVQATSPSVSVCYVDDLNFTSPTKQGLILTMTTVWRFVEDFLSWLIPGQDSGVGVESC